MEEQSTPKRGRPPKQAAPQIRWRGQTEFRHDLFKLKPAKFKKNVSIVPGDPKIIQDESTEHVHIFHTHNSQGKELTKTNAVGGHWHEVTVSTDEHGNLRAECGPPMKNNYKKTSKGVRKKAGPVIFRDAEGNTVTDDHRHDVDYIQSEMLNPKDRRANAQFGGREHQIMQELRQKGLKVSGSGVIDQA